MDMSFDTLQLGDQALETRSGEETRPVRKALIHQAKQNRRTALSHSLLLSMNAKTAQSMQLLMKAMHYDGTAGKTT